MASYMGHEYTPAPATQGQGRYRVGDRVRVIDADGGGKVGDIGTVTSAEYVHVPGGGEEFYYRISGLSRNATGLLGYRLAPAFRPGDRVKLNKHSGMRACGERGTVSAVLGDNVSVRMDDVSVYGTVVAFFHVDNLDWERGGGCHDNVETLTIKPVLDTTDFDSALAEFRAAYNQPCIVALTTNGKPRPSTYPHVHASVEAATKEAERLARNNPGQEFAVYQRVAGRQCEVSYEMKEVA